MRQRSPFERIFPAFMCIIIVIVCINYSKWFGKKQELPLLDVDYSSEFVLDTKEKKFHTTECESVAEMGEENREDYSGSYNELIQLGYLPDENCFTISEE